MYFTGVIDPAAWDRASWKGTVFGWPVDGSGPPFLGLFFENIEAGSQIFKTWRRVLGTSDNREIIRIAIIEGEIPDKDPGYTVHIGTNFDSVSKAASPGEGPSLILMTSRVHRMNPDPDSNNLPGFKAHYEAYGSYLFLPVGGTEVRLEPRFDLCIHKHEIHFRDISEVSDDDLDAPILARPHAGINGPSMSSNVNDIARDALTVSLGILESELASGRLAERCDQFVLESLASVEYDGEGWVHPDTVSPPLFLLAHEIAAERLEADASRIPLLDIQGEYVELLERSFGSLYEEMVQLSLTPHEVAKRVSDNPSLVDQISRESEDDFSRMREYWQGRGIVALAHLRRQATLKAVYCGNLFPHPASDFGSNVSLYADTLVLPDPLLGASCLNEAATAKESTFHLIKSAMTAMSYRELAIAEVSVPLAVFVPDRFLLEPGLRHVLWGLTEADVCVHMERIFGVQFDNYDAVLEYFAAASSDADLAASVKDHERFTLDVEELPLPLDQMAASEEICERFKRGVLPADFRERLPFEFAGRFLQANIGLANCHLYDGVPLVDAPTSWKYLLWQFEYIGVDSDAQLRDTVLQHVLHEEVKDLFCLRHLNAKDIIQLRADGVLERLRILLREGIHEIKGVEERDVEDAARGLAARLREEVGNHKKAVEALEQDGKGLAKNAVYTTGVASLTIAATCTGNIPLGILSALLGVGGIKSGREMVSEGRRLLRERDNLRHSPVGLFFNLPI